ncbi:uncharacterized protein LOC132031768 [Lycium ferocissimum]|uniref:uncharacterized protein LOC132031768 n=1 Tax=Lycium ferocissimum TaxID=112874 RepID=UPI002816351B|nr:uncharacterized protein LOC132031768 [Lycium ferocissimum]
MWNEVDRPGSCSEYLILNATFVALIPKKARAIELNDFRPISLIGGVYKIIAKLLAERLKKVIHKLVDRQQMAFIKGRQIMDAVLIANECVESRQRSKKPGILCKLDIQKAYDHLNWSFLINMLERMGFGTRWIKWIKHCISSVKFSVLVNRTPCGFFPSQRGLRQGDPLSPFLFILAMEGMSNMFQTAKVNGWIRGFQVGAGNLEITHLQYADDNLVFCEAVAEVESLAEKLGGKVGELPTTYLGMPLGAKSKSKGIWNGVLEKCEKKLTNWKSQYLSLGGRLTMVNSVLDALPSYMMSIFPIPVNGNEDKKKFHLVKWEELTRKHMLWKEVITAKYGLEDKWMTNMVNTPYGCTVWRAIRNHWPIMLARIRCKVGNGLKVSFWNDIWLGDTALKVKFPALFVLSQKRHATVAEMWTGQGWDLDLRRHLNDWEMEMVAEFHSTMAAFINLTGERDTLEWKKDGKGIFTVNSAYKDLNVSSLQEEGWPWKMIWKTKVPYKVNCFNWLLAKEAVLTHENLNKRDQLWRMFINLRKIRWVKPGSIEGVLKCWNRDGNVTRKEERWKIVPSCIWWTVWKERNQRCFENKQNNLQKLKMNCLALFYFWCKQEILDQTEDIFDVLDLL